MPANWSARELVNESSTADRVVRAPLGSALAEVGGSPGNGVLGCVAVEPSGAADLRGIVMTFPDGEQ